MLYLEHTEPKRLIHPGWKSGQTVLSPAVLATVNLPTGIQILWPLGGRAGTLIETQEFNEWRTATDQRWAESLSEWVNRMLCRTSTAAWTSPSIAYTDLKAKGRSLPHPGAE